MDCYSKLGKKLFMQIIKYKAYSIFLRILRGYQLPFFLMGGLLSLTFFLAYFKFPDVCHRKNPQNHELRSSLPILPLLKSPKFVTTLMVLFCGSFSTGFLDPSLESHVESVKKSFLNIS